MMCVCLNIPSVADASRYGAPTHRIESQLEAMAKVLEINAAVMWVLRDSGLCY
jgi:hypothetical protein